MKAAKRFLQAFPKAGVSWPGITDGPMSEAGNEQREGRGPLPAGNLRVRGPDARCAPVRRVPRRGAPPPAEADLRTAARPGRDRARAAHPRRAGRTRLAGTAGDAGNADPARAAAEACAGRRRRQPALPARGSRPGVPAHSRSEEHTSELQSLMRISYAVLRLK